MVLNAAGGKARETVDLVSRHASAFRSFPGSSECFRVSIVSHDPMKIRFHGDPRGRNGWGWT